MHIPRTTILSCLTALLVVYIVLFTSNKVSDWIFSSHKTFDLASYAPNNQAIGGVTKGKQTEDSNQTLHQNKIHVNQSISKIIHQIWNDEILPLEFVKNVQGLVRDNPSPEWKYYFWTKKNGLEFIKNNFGSFYERSTRAATVMRADILRYLVIYKYGGVYFDMDTVSVKPLKNFVETHSCSLALEPAENYFFYSVTTDFILANSALLCRPNHLFYRHIIQYIETMPNTCTNAIFCTGPPVISRLYQDLNKTNNNTWLPDVQPSEVFEDAYDVSGNRKLLDDNCYNKIKELSPFHVKMCANWISRGKENRNVSEQALTYHTFFHILGRPLHLDRSNHIKNIVPHAMLYGKDFK